MLTNAQYNRLVDTLTFEQLKDLCACEKRIGLSCGISLIGDYPILWKIDEEAFLQIAYAAILVLDLALPE